MKQSEKLHAYARKIEAKATQLVKDSIRKAIRDGVDDIVESIMVKFEEEIVAHEDPADPMRPSLFREDLRRSITATILNTIEVVGNTIRFKIRDEESFGVNEKLSKSNVDGLKVINTIIEGISGDWVLVTAQDGIYEDFEGGWTDTAYLVPKDRYDFFVDKYGWPRKAVWSFSNFPPVRDFFKIDKQKLISLIKYHIKDRLETTRA